MQVGIAIGQEADLERFDQIVDGRRAREHRRHHDQRSRFRRNSVAIVHARQRTRRRKQRHQPVDERHRQLTGAQRDEHAAQREQPTVRAAGARMAQQVCGEERRQQRRSGRGTATADTARRIRRTALVQRSCASGRFVPVAAIRFRSGRTRHGPHARRPGSRMPRPAPAARPSRATSTSDVGAALGDLLEHVPVVIAGGKVHAGVHAAGILAKRTLGDAQRFRRTPASPSRRESAGCRCCSRSIPGRRPDAGFPPAPVA